MRQACAWLRAVIAWALAAVCVAWVVVRAFGLERGYPMVPVLAFTPLAVAGAVAVALLAALLRKRAAALVALLAAVALAALVAPRVLGGPSGAEGEPGPRLRVLTANVYQQPGGRPGADRRWCASTRPDVVSVQELTPRVWRASSASCCRAGARRPRRGASAPGLRARAAAARSGAPGARP